MDFEWINFVVKQVHDDMVNLAPVKKSWLSEPTPLWTRVGLPLSEGNSPTTMGAGVGCLQIWGMSVKQDAEHEPVWSFNVCLVKDNIPHTWKFSKVATDNRKTADDAKDATWFV